VQSFFSEPDLFPRLFASIRLKATEGEGHVSSTNGPRRRWRLFNPHVRRAHTGGSANHCVRGALMVTQHQDVSEPRTEWPALLMSISLPIVVAMGFIRLASASSWGWEASETWLYGLIALVPLEFIRIVVLVILAQVYKDSSGPREAIGLFLGITAIFAVIGLVWAVVELGPQDVFALLTTPVFYKVLALPVLILLIDCVVGIATFHGNPKVQAARLDAIGTDSYEWLTCAAFRIPMTVALASLLAVIFFRIDHSDEWAAFVHSDAPRAIGLSYLAAYFLVKAAIVGHAYTARFAGTGKRLLQCGRILRWLLGFGTC